MKPLAGCVGTSSQLCAGPDNNRLTPKADYECGFDSAISPIKKANPALSFSRSPSQSEEESSSSSSTSSSSLRLSSSAPSSPASSSATSSPESRSTPFAPSPPLDAFRLDGGTETSLVAVSDGESPGPDDSPLPPLVTQSLSPAPSPEQGNHDASDEETSILETSLHAHMLAAPALFVSSGSDLDFELDSDIASVSSEGSSRSRQSRFSSARLKKRHSSRRQQRTDPKTHKFRRSMNKLQQKCRAVEAERDTWKARYEEMALQATVLKEKQSTWDEQKRAWLQKEATWKAERIAAEEDARRGERSAWQAAENKRAAEQRKMAENKQAVENKRAAEQRKMAENKQAAENKRAAEQRKLAENKRKQAEKLERLKREKLELTEQSNRARAALTLENRRLKDKLHDNEGRLASFRTQLEQASAKRRQHTTATAQLKTQLEASKKVAQTQEAYVKSQFAAVLHRKRQSSWLEYLVVLLMLVMLLIFVMETLAVSPPVFGSAFRSLAAPLQYSGLGADLQYPS